MGAGPPAQRLSIKRNNPLRGAATRTVLLSAEHASQEYVARCCAVAQAAGVVPGMPLAEAKALVPRARVAVFDPEKSRCALGLLAKWCFRFSPVVSVDPVAAPLGGAFRALLEEVPDGLLLDVTGEAHLFGTEHVLLTELATRLARLGFSSRLAIAPTIGAAWALARYGPHPLAVVDDDHLQPALTHLPVAALRLPAEVRAAMHEVGIELVGHLLRLPRESLVPRFGEDLLVRMDQAFDRLAEQIEPIHPSEPLTVRRVFDGATTAIEALFLCVQGLLAELSRQLLERESGVRGLRVELARINASPASREIVLGQPSRDAKHLWALLRPKMEAINLGYGIEAVSLTAYWTDRIRHRQTGAWGMGESEDNHDGEFAAFIDTLINRWGSGRILAPQPVASHVPEVARGFRPLREEANPAVVPRKPGGARREWVETDLLFVDRPTVLLEHPEEAEAIALQPDHAPTRLIWRDQEHALRTGTGPERITTAWWRGARGAGATLPSTRDYFKVQTTGGMWLWVFREAETGKWYVHGVWT